MQHKVNNIFLQETKIQTSVSFKAAKLNIAIEIIVFLFP